jgi:hypothetical protein
MQGLSLFPERERPAQMHRRLCAATSLASGGAFEGFGVKVEVVFFNCWCSMKQLRNIPMREVQYASCLGEAIAEGAEEAFGPPAGALGSSLA